ncbi:hypothetical protein [Azospirillum sp. A39]|uniref:hypothetical protein n=1 Tax=Azospirillum sp. A39 TaxID=3462279 RepID=UPI0040454A01
MFALGIPNRRTARPAAGRPADAVPPAVDRSWLSAAAVFLAAVLVAMVLFHGAALVRHDGDPLSLPEQTRPMIMVPMHH